MVDYFMLKNINLHYIYDIFMIIYNIFIDYILFIRYYLNNAFKIKSNS